MPAGARSLLPLLGALLLVVHYGRVEFVPPLSEIELGSEQTFAPGADWDRQWEMALVGAEYAQRGVAAHWDPYAGGGSPLLANPESFAHHPAFRAVAPRGPAAAMHALYVTALAALFGGLWWWGRLLGVPWPAAMLAGVVLVTSYELRARLGAGHVMALGMAYWPLALAAARDGLREGRSWRGRALLGAAAGATIGLAAAGGGHYAAVFGLLLILLMLWAEAAPVWARATLVVVAVAPALATSSALHVPLLVVGAAAVVGGVVQSRHRLGAPGATGLGVVVGYLAVHGSAVVPALSVSRLAGRLRGPFAELQVNSDLVLGDILRGGTPQVDALLYFGPAWVWPVLMLGVALLLLRAPALGVAVAVASAMGLLATVPSAAWELVGVFPGMSAVNYPERLQWAVLVFAPLGLALATSWLPTKGRAGAAVTAALALAGVALIGWADRAHPLQDPTFTGSTWSAERTSARGAVVGVTDRPERHLAHSPIDGRAHPQTELALRFPSPDGDDHVPPGDALVRRPDAPDWREAAGTVAADLRDWAVTGPPGEVVEVRQRDIWGWDCGGARRPAAELTGAAWLRVQLDAEGRAACRWTSPGFGAGVAVQLLATVALVGLVVPLRRRGGGVRGRAGAGAPPG